MGGEHDRLTAAEAASVIGWWIEAGVDVAIQERPRAWLGEATARTAEIQDLPRPQPTQELPATLEAFRGWLTHTTQLPFATPNSRRVLPYGSEVAEVMLLADMPTAEDMAQDQPIAGAAWELAQRMLAAIGFTSAISAWATLTRLYGVLVLSTTLRFTVSLTRPSAPSPSVMYADPGDGLVV